MKPDFSQTVVIFDLDGTFVDTAEDLAAAMNGVLAEEGLAPLKTRRVRHLVGHGAKAMLRRGLAESGVADLSEAALEPRVRRFLALYETGIADASRPFPGALEAVETLRTRGARLAICTNKQERLARRLLETLGLSALFGAIVGGDTTAAAKPDPRPLQRCLEAVGGGRAVLVGDSDTDIDAAIAAGAPSLIFTQGYGPILKVGRSAGVFGHYRALPMVVERTLLRGNHPARHAVDHVAAQISPR